VSKSTWSRMVNSSYHEHIVGNGGKKILRETERIHYNLIYRYFANVMPIVMTTIFFFTDDFHWLGYCIPLSPLWFYVIQELLTKIIIKLLWSVGQCGQWPLIFFSFRILPASNSKIKTTLMPDVCIIYWTIKYHQYSVVLQNDLNHLTH